MNTVAILGPTASGKSDLAIDLARKFGAAILSLDSLSIYKEIDIASAKPSVQERGEIPHFGIDVITPDHPFNVALYLDLYREAAQYCETKGCDLLIVGGTGFYLKILLEGISDLPPLKADNRQRLKEWMRDLDGAYERLMQLDADYARKIASTDRYRIEKGLSLYLSTGETPTSYFKSHPPRPLIQDARLYEIAVDKAELWQRIEKRTDAMLAMGLIDEVAALEKRYGRRPNPMKAIGIREVLDYFDGRLTHDAMRTEIIYHTRQLAKRQKTFNRTQFPHHPALPRERLYEEISKRLEA